LGSEHVPVVPSRRGLELELRLPLWVLPRDLILLAPVLGLAPNALTKVAIRAASGGEL
jgi:hypothetical protein